MIEKSMSALNEAVEGGMYFKDICIIPPDITVADGSLFLRIGKKNKFKFLPHPGIRTTQ